MILSILEELVADNGKIYKENVLNKHKTNEVFKDVLRLAYSPTIQFYVKKIPSYSKEPNQIDLMTALRGIELVLHTRIKTGNEAIKFLAYLLSALPERDEEVLMRVIDKDLKVGIQAKTINKIFGRGFIRETPYMGAISYNKKKAEKIFTEFGGGISEVKMDGRYVNIIVSDGAVDLMSRSGKPTYLMGALANDALKLREKFDYDVVFNGELIISGVYRYISNGIIASLVSIGTDHNNGKDIERKVKKFKKDYGISVETAKNKVVAVVWDFIPYEYYINQKTFDESRENRLNTLEERLTGLRNIKLIEYKAVNSLSEATNHFQEMLAIGEEGTILKGRVGIWESKKPNYQIKMKFEMTVDLKIVGYQKGKDGTRFENTLGALVCESSDGIVKTDAPGLVDAMRDEFWLNKDKYLGRIVEVKCNGLSSNKDGEYALLHPVFISVRDDKDEADNFEMIQENENMIKSLGRN